MLLNQTDARRQVEMKNRMKVLSVLLLLIMFVLNLGGCSNLAGPSDEEVIKAINDYWTFFGWG